MAALKSFQWPPANSSQVVNFMQRSERLLKTHGFRRLEGRQIESIRWRTSSYETRQVIMPTRVASDRVDLRPARQLAWYVSEVVPSLAPLEKWKVRSTARGPS